MTNDEFNSLLDPGSTACGLNAIWLRDHATWSSVPGVVKLRTGEWVVHPPESTKLIRPEGIQPRYPDKESALAALKIIYG